MYPDKLGSYPDHVNRTLSEAHDPTFLKRSSLTSSSRSSARASRISRSRRLSFFGTTTPTRVPPARDPALHAILRPGRNPDLALPVPAHPAVAAADRTRLLDDPALPPTPGTRRREREKPLVSALHAPTPTLRTRQRRTSRGRPRAPALAARLLDRHPNPRRYTVQGIFETQPDVYGYILASYFGRPGGTGRTSEDIPQVPEAAEQIRDVPEVRTTRLSGALGAEEGAGAFVVFPSFLGFREDLVGLLYLFETLFGRSIAWVGGGMVLAS